MPAITQEEQAAKHKAVIAARERRTGKKQTSPSLTYNPQLFWPEPRFINKRDGSMIEGPLTDETAPLTLSPPGEGLYRILRDAGALIEEALICVMHMELGEHERANEIWVKYGFDPLD
jgi:hypothetical protein